MNSARPECQWCCQTFKTKGSLGRHYDLWVHAVDPRGPDQQHPQEAIEEMRRIRSQTKRKKYSGIPVGKSSPERKRAMRSMQNKTSYARHGDKKRAHANERRDYFVARAMVLREIEKEGVIRECIASEFDISPDAESGLVNFATIVYHFLPHPSSLFPGHEGRNPPVDDSAWKIAIPDHKDYLKLCLRLHPDRDPERGNAWMQRLATEWNKWEVLDEEEQSVKTMEELARAFVRQKQKAEALQCFAPTTIRARIEKWELRIRESRRSGKPILLDDLDSLLAHDIHELFPNLSQESEEEAHDIDLNEVFNGNGGEAEV